MTMYRPMTVHKSVGIFYTTCLSHWAHMYILVITTFKYTKITEVDLFPYVVKTVS